ncbi:uncharacterized protein LOC125032114 isoform X2 [Penaeus chinensis]|uniref:uncharacterized protein LOC125032114 isoform X2 n=1 Tax=Penaeus chinensis TaxID=139456 RepID=UPI001FB849CB|nr:uncharacterized protein LOC125032114 isoform X2 [Penaeus chinensis]
MKAMDQAAPMITVPAGVLKEFMSPANSRTPTPPATASVTTSAVSKSSTPTPAASSNSRTPSPALPSSSETASASLHMEKSSSGSPAVVSLTNGDINSDSSTQDVDIRMEYDTSDTSLTESSRAVDEKTSVEGANEGVVNGTGVKRPSDEDNGLKKPDLKKIRVFAPAEEDGFKKGDISIAVQEFNQHLDKASKKLEEAGKTDLDNIKADSFNSANTFFNDDKTNHSVQPPANNNVRNYDVEVISSPSKDIEVLPVLPNDKDKDTLPPVSVEKAPTQDKESKHIKKKLQRLSRKDLENMIMRLFSEKILYQTELGKLKQLCERSESTLETNRKKTAQFHKEVEDLRKVTNRLSAEHAARKGQYVAPIRIKRSVGIQASPHIINKGILHANGSAGVIKTIAPRASALVGVGNATSPIRPTTVQSTDPRKQSIPPPNVTFNTQMIPTSSSTNNVVSGGPVGLLASSQGVSNIATNSSLSTVTNPVASIGTVRPSAGQMLMVAQPGMMQTIPRASGAGVMSKTTSAVIPVAQRRVVHTSLGNRVAAPRPAGLGPTPGTLVKVPVTGTTQLVAIPQAGQVVLLPPVSGGQPATALVVSNVTMTRDRYDLLTANLHFSDNEDPAAADDRLWKLRPVMDTLQRTFKEVFTPEEKIAVDESLWAYRGRHHAVQYNPSKRARFGMKVYKLCSSDGKAAGYTSAFRVYMGQDRSDVPPSMKAVVDLMHEAGLFEKGYQLYIDNWYSSSTLFHYLQSRKTETVGTVRLNRKFMPKDLSVKRKGEVDIRTSRAGMLAMSWFDKKQVNILSTIHRGDEMVDLPPNRRGEVRRKPLSVVDYNKGMKGVDISDQLAQSYPAARKTNKWYVKLFYNLLDMAIINAHAVHKWLGGKLTQLEFRLQLTAELLQRPTGLKVRRRRSVTPQRAATPSRSLRSPSQPRSNNMTHTIEENEGGKYRCCKYCRQTKGKKDHVSIRLSAMRCRTMSYMFYPIPYKLK